METQDEISLWLAEATLISGGQEVSAFVVSDIKDQVAAGGTLDTALQNIQAFDRKPGDFGAEIIGALIVPVVIEAAKQLWASYLKELTQQVNEMAQQGGKQLASMTIDSAKALVRRVWTDEPEISTRYATLVRAEAERQGLPSEQIELLVNAITSPALAERLKDA